MVSMGNTKDMAKFLDFTSFPPDKLLLDQGEVFYTSLKCKKGMLRSLVHPYMWFVVACRKIRKGKIGDLMSASKQYRVLVPEKTDQGWQQGGTFVFKGRRLLWAHRDSSPSDYPELDDVMTAVDDVLAQ